MSVASPLRNPLPSHASRLRPSPIRAILDRCQGPGILRLAAGLPDEELIPAAELAASAARASAAPATFQYAGTAGHPELRRWVAARLARRGFVCGPDQVLITSGAQHALAATALALTGPGVPVAVESPGYPGTHQAFSLTGATLHPWDPRPGLSLHPPAEVALAVVTPAGGNPTGRRWDQAGRASFVRDCAARGVLVVEDDTYGELWLDRPGPPPVAGRNGGPETVLIGSLSKILAPGLRLGWIVAPPARRDHLVAALQATGLHANGLAQATAVDWLARHDLDRHLEGLRSTYRTRRDALLRAVADHLPGAGLEPPADGLFAWLRLPEGISAERLAQQALAVGVAVLPGGPFLLHPSGDPDADRHLRLCFATEPAERLTAAIATLAQLCQIIPGGHHHPCTIWSTP